MSIGTVCVVTEYHDAIDHYRDSTDFPELLEITGNQEIARTIIANRKSELIEEALKRKAIIILDYPDYFKNKLGAVDYLRIDWQNDVYERDEYLWTIEDRRVICSEDIS